MPPKTKPKASNRLTPELRKKWRSQVPEMERIVEEVSPAMWEDAAERRLQNVPAWWKQAVAAMQAEVKKRAAEDHSERSLDEKHGYHWHSQMIQVIDLLRYLFLQIRNDIGFEDGAGMASMLLVERAAQSLLVELRDGSTEDAREGGEENIYRVIHALTQMTPRFDDLQMQRFRALEIAKYAASHTRDPFDRPEHVVIDAKAEEFHTVRWPAMQGVFIRHQLAEIDPMFSSLDPLVVFEEFRDAEGEARGGRSGGGDSRIGPARALAHLAVTCGGLGAGAHENETSDEAVERIRHCLLASRSRIRREIRSFPGQTDGPETDESEAECGAVN